MRTRPPKHIRASTADVYRELSGLLTEAGLPPLRPSASPLPLNLNVSADVPTLETM